MLRFNGKEEQPFTNKGVEDDEHENGGKFKKYIYIYSKLGKGKENEKNILFLRFNLSSFFLFLNLLNAKTKLCIAKKTQSSIPYNLFFILRKTKYQILTYI